MDINTMDESGMVVLPIHSNSVLIDATDRAEKNDSSNSRPIFDLDVAQSIDTRGVITSGGIAGATASQEKEIKIEISATGRGVLPELEDLVKDLGTAIPGYAWNREKTESEPLQVVGVKTSSRAGIFGNQDSESDAYIEPDGDGLFRLPTTRKWTVRFEPSSMTSKNIINVPQLASGLAGKLTSERYVDMDLVPIESETIPIQEGGKTNVAMILGIVSACVLLPVFVLLWLRVGNSMAPALDETLKMPNEITPFSAVITLQRFAKHHAAKMSNEDRGQLLKDISNLEQAYFGVHPKSDAMDAKDTVVRWHQHLTHLT
jgi:hypothetical protein